MILIHIISFIILYFINNILKQLFIPKTGYDTYLFQIRLISRCPLPTYFNVSHQYSSSIESELCRSEYQSVSEVA